MATSAVQLRLRVLLIFAVAVAIVSLSVWIQAKRSRAIPETAIQDSREAFSTPAFPAVSPTDRPNVSSWAADPKTEPGLTSGNQQQLQDPPLTNNFLGAIKLIIPVAGIKPDQLLDTFTDSRAEGRAHDAIDIMAAAGTPVLATADGEIGKLFQSERGGTTIYQLSADRKVIFYYAHLQRYADGISPGKIVRQGDIIAFVGDTGNAGAGNYHLHFSISIVADPKRYWEGTNINPFPLLRSK